ncbi:MAG: flavodoxin-dependent (E)-4-hydroxy-3-methylbut-2-enyl-diphosphate synthase [Elusimicrobiota bacterium]
MESSRRNSRETKVGLLTIGGSAPIIVQSMCSTDTRDITATVRQIKQLEKVGCELVRVAVPDFQAAGCLGAIKKKINLPLAADIHFDYRLALAAIEQGVDKLRINPGNIGSKEKVKLIVAACQKKKIPIRIGVNAGSLKVLHSAAVSFTPEQRAEKMAASALEQIRLLESLNFFEIIVSLKASDIPTTLSAYRLMAAQCVYPLHLGVTEAGTLFSGTIKSAVGMAILLSEGIGDTIRVSLTAEPAEEIKVGYEILKALKLRSFGPEIISCPTCGRCQINLIKIVQKLEEEIAKLLPNPALFPPLKIAVMGCVVNGPGEAREADIGIAGGRGEGLFLKKGKTAGKIPEKLWVPTLLKEIKKFYRLN